jgi:non-ribosomal peptide synthetase component F
MGYLFELFTSCHARIPSGLALDTGVGTRTYDELMGDTFVWANWLKRKGVAPGTRVGLASTCGSHLYAATLALSRIDCVIVPFAADTLGEIDRLRELGVRTVLTVDADEPQMTRLDSVPPQSWSPAAYIISTSGSTSSPKNVPITDENLRSLGTYVQTASCLSEHDRMVQSYAPTFDAFFEVLLLAWTSGLCLVLPRLREHLLVARFVNERNITVWNSVPSQLRIARRLGHLAENSMPGVRVCVLGGEALPADLVGAWRAAAPNSAVINLYGPTETTICVAKHVIAPGEELQLVNGLVPIGHVFPHLESRLVPLEDSDDIFELCLRGPQRLVSYEQAADNVGRFYGDAPHSAAVREVGSPDARSWYRTGDLVSLSEVGLVYRGRLNKEIKVLGRRIDLAEVEAALLADGRVRAAHADVVADSVVAVVEGDAGDGTPINLSSLRDYARPTRITWMHALPLLPNGKTNTKALHKAMHAARSIES